VLSKLLKYKYFILVGFFLLWISFFDSSNLIAISKLQKERAKLSTEKEYYINEIKKAKELRSELFGSKENLEKFARETYLMKKEDEDLFVIIEDQKE